MILLKKCLLAFFGLCAGGIIAAGVYAFLAIIGVFVRLMGKTGTRKHIFLYETVIILGGVLGNILDIYEFPIYMGPYLGTLFICAYGLSVGIFVGCLVMSLADTESPSGYQPEDSSGRGASISDICPGRGENGGISGIFLESYSFPWMTRPKMMRQKGFGLSAAGF